ncbi:MAG TPA: hypothetical protein PKV33_02685 [Methanothrix sp.]|nr:hypothetical protein [Methanothrix sp.]
MPREGSPTICDVSFLDDATKSLLGYFVHTWYRHYLEVISNNFKRLFDKGIIKSIYEPTEFGRRSLLFDSKALDIEKITYINGIYFYIFSAHKGANCRLMNKNPSKQVLYLRGYDYEGSVTTGDGLAMGFSSIDTMAFTWSLADQLSKSCQLFKVLSPKDVYWETVTAQRYFYGNFDDMIHFAHSKMCSVFLNALYWKEGVAHLLDRMDYYIVYVSSVTESVLWELDQLDTDERRGRVTVVLDEEAIQNKELQLGMRDRMQDEYGDRLIWSKKGQLPELSADELHKKLSSKFLVTTPDDFSKNIKEHRRRIDQSSAPLGPGLRETWLEFRFYPSLDKAGLKNLRNFSAEVEAHIADMIGNSGIDCLPLFLNLVQLRIFMTLLLAEHYETGRALVTYAAVMQAAHDYYAASGDKAGALSRMEHKNLLDMLNDHFKMAHYIGWSMLSSGKSHEFDDFRAVAQTVFDTEFDRTRTAVNHFFNYRSSEKD